MASIYQSTGEKRRLGFKYLINRIIQQKTYYEAFAVISLIFTIFFVIIICLFKDNYFFTEGVFTDLWNSTFNIQHVLNNNKTELQIYSEVYQHQVVVSDEFKTSIYTIILRNLITSFLKIGAIFIICFYFSTKLSRKKIDEITDQIHEDKVLRGSKVLKDEEYINKLKELGEYAPDDGAYITLSGVYERELIKRGGEDDDKH